jgi:hypothetical protein
MTYYTISLKARNNFTRRWEEVNRKCPESLLKRGYLPQPNPFYNHKLATPMKSTKIF